MIDCPRCGNTILKSYPGNKVKLRTNIIIWESGGQAFCKCNKCHKEVHIPVSIELPTGKRLGHVIIEGKKK